MDLPEIVAGQWQLLPIGTVRAEEPDVIRSSASQTGSQTGWTVHEVTDPAEIGRLVFSPEGALEASGECPEPVRQAAARYLAAANG